MNLGEMVQKVQEVCPFPASARRVAELAKDESAPIERIAAAIATDAALAAQLMRLANSAAFGRTRQITNIEHAVVLIGTDEIGRMAAAMGMLAAFHTKSELEFNFHDRAVVAGSLARGLAKKMQGVDPAVAFLAGLLADVGAMACAAVDAAEYRKIWKSCPDPRAREALELARYGATSREIGAELLRRNDLPEIVVSAVGAAFGDPEASPLGLLTGFCRLATFSIRDAGGDPAALSEALAALAAEARFPVPNDVVFETCVSAAGVALSALRTNR